MHPPPPEDPPAPRCDAPPEHAAWIEAVYWGADGPPRPEGLETIEPARVTLGLDLIFDVSRAPPGPRPFALFWTLVELSTPQQELWNEGKIATHLPVFKQLSTHRDSACVMGR